MAFISFLFTLLALPTLCAVEKLRVNILFFEQRVYEVSY